MYLFILNACTSEKFKEGNLKIFEVVRLIYFHWLEHFNQKTRNALVPYPVHLIRHWKLEVYLKRWHINTYIYCLHHEPCQIDINIEFKAINLNCPWLPLIALLNLPFQTLFFSPIFHWHGMTIIPPVLTLA